MGNSSSLVLPFPHPGEMPPCLICAYVMGALCVCALVIWTTLLLVCLLFNDAHLDKRSLLGGYGPLARGRLLHQGDATVARLSENTVLSGVKCSLVSVFVC